MSDGETPAFVTFSVHMLALMGPGHVREVRIPSEIVRDGSVDLINAAVVNMGRNDRVMSDRHVSVSPGDVIEWGHGDGCSRYYLIEMIGFMELSRDEFLAMRDGAPYSRGESLNPFSGMEPEMATAAAAILAAALADGKIVAELVNSGATSEDLVAALKARL